MSEAVLNKALLHMPHPIPRRANTHFLSFFPNCLISRPQCPSVTVMGNQRRLKEKAKVIYSGLQRQVVYWVRPRSDGRRKTSHHTHTTPNNVNEIHVKLMIGHL